MLEAIADLAACILRPTVWGSRGYKYLRHGRKGLSMTGSRHPVDVHKRQRSEGYLHFGGGLGGGIRALILASRLISAGPRQIYEYEPEV